MTAHGPRRRSLAALAILIAIFALSACQSSHTRVIPTPTATLAPPTPPPTALPTQPVNQRPSPVAGLLGPAPTNCATAAPPGVLNTTNFGGGFSSPMSFEGSAPAWELGLGSVLQLEPTDGTSTPYPSTKVMWVVGPNFTQPVTLTGRELTTGASLWFQVYPSNGVATDNPDAISVYTTHAVLDPAAPNRGSTDNSTGHWNIWGIGIIVLSAGCYQLDITSAAGSWKMVFAAGR